MSVGDFLMELVAKHLPNIAKAAATEAVRQAAQGFTRSKQNAGSDETRKSAESIFKDVAQEIESLKKRTETLAHDLNRLSSKVEEETGEIQGLAKRVSSAEQQLPLLSKQMGEVKLGVEAVQDRVATAEQQSSLLLKQINEVKAGLEVVQDRVGTAEKGIERVDGDLTEANLRTQSLFRSLRWWLLGLSGVQLVVILLVIALMHR